MITSQLRDGVVWLTVDGELLAKDMIAETNQWLLRKGEFAGFISDVRKMTACKSAEKLKLEEERKRNKSGKPNAILIKDDAMSAVVKIYMRLTGAEQTRYFTSEREAVAWLKNSGK